MSLWHIVAAVALAALAALSFAIPLSFSQAALIWGIAALACAYPLIHAARDPKVAIISLLLLAVFASFPLKKYLGLDGMIEQSGATLAYGCVLFLAGMGWKRRWS